jgi:hypothetical protein
MSDLATAKSNFLSRVEDWAPAQAARFAPIVDELIRWSEENGLEFTRPTGAHALVRFRVPGTGMPFWVVSARTGDGAKLTILADPRFPEPLRSEARDELSRIGRKAADPESAPELALTHLIWEPYRQRVLDLMSRLLAEVRGATAATAETE